MASRELTNLVEELKALACVDDVVWVAHTPWVLYRYIVHLSNGDQLSLVWFSPAMRVSYNYPFEIACLTSDGDIWGEPIGRLDHSEVIEQVKQYGGEPPVTNMCATVHYRGVRKLKL